MKLSEIGLTIEAVNAGETAVVLCNKGDYFEYKDGKRTSEERAGVKYTVALPNNRLQCLDVKVPGSDSTPELTPEKIAERLAELDLIRVSFQSSTVKFFRTKEGGEGITASAKGVTVCPDNTLDFGSGFGKEKK